MYEYKARITNVVDGDTFDAEVDLGFGVSFRERFRLARVNTPETHGVKKDSDEYKRGTIATNIVKDFVQQYETCTIRTIKDKKGKYGRYIAEVLFGEDVVINLSDYLVQEGYATYTKY